MNILPKKRWHVRTRENIARVRKDEQEAASEAEERKQRVLRAEKEARTSLLRERAQKKYDCVQTVSIQETGGGSTSDDQKHVNFFEDLEVGKIVTTKANIETEREKKEIREKYERQIGYLTYLGQDTVESTGNVPWYERVPNHAASNSTMKDEKNMKSKSLHDPLAIFRKYLPSRAKTGISPDVCKRKSSVMDYDPIFNRKDKKKKHKKNVKKHKKRKYISNDDPTSESEQSTSESGEETKEREKRKSLDLLRAERLRREKQERERSEALLNKINGVTPQNSKTEPITPVVHQKYNSQYNPGLAKQNYSKSPWSK